MAWIRFKHKRQLKSYLRNIVSTVTEPNKQTNLLKIISDKTTEVQFFGKIQNEENLSLTILAWVQDDNFFGMHGFELEDSVEWRKVTGDESVKDFVTIHDLFKKGIQIPELPVLVEAFWENLIYD